MSAIPDVTSLKNNLLLAMPGVSDPLFAHSVTLLCEHSREGAMGIVINRPLDINWRDVFEQLNCSSAGHEDRQVLAGGPVQMGRGFVLHPRTEQQWDHSLNIGPEATLTTSMDIINALANGEGPPDSLLALGYAGWSAGQLEHEIANNFWLTLPADYQLLFCVPLHLKAEAAARKLGIDLDLMSPVAGHA